MSRSSPVRTGVSFIVGLVSLVVLGVVWGTVVLNLPNQELAPPVDSPSPAVPPVAAVLLPPISPMQSPPSPVGESPVPSREVPVTEVPTVEPPRISASVELKCQAEVEQLCPEGAPGGDRRRCLQSRGHNLSPVCRQVAQERMVRVKEGLQRMKIACEEDARKFCRNVPPGPGHMLQCLEEHSQDVSEQCYQTLPRRGMLN